jgi:hypothetical protein
MPDYRAYFISTDGHFYKSADLDAPDDTAASQPPSITDMMLLWQPDRKIAKFEHAQAS